MHDLTSSAPGSDISYMRPHTDTDRSVAQEEATLPAAILRLTTCWIFSMHHNLPLCSVHAPIHYFVGEIGHMSRAGRESSQNVVHYSDPPFAFVQRPWARSQSICGRGRMPQTRMGISLSTYTPTQHMPAETTLQMWTPSTPTR